MQCNHFSQQIILEDGGSKLIQIISDILPGGMALYTSSMFIFKRDFNLVVVTWKEPVYNLIVSLMSQVGY